MDGVVELWGALLTQRQSSRFDPKLWVKVCVEIS